MNDKTGGILVLTLADMTHRQTCRVVVVCELTLHRCEHTSDCPSVCHIHVVVRSNLCKNVVLRGYGR